MARKDRRKNTPVSNDGWGETSFETLSRAPDEVPKKGSVAAKKQGSLRFYRIFFIVILGSAVIAPAMTMALGNRVTAVEYDLFNRPDPATISSPGKAAAYEAEVSWLADDPQPLPGGTVVSWDGFDKVDKPEQSEQEKRTSPLPDYELEIHHFTLVGGNGNLYTSSVQVAIGSEDIGTSIVGTPSLNPIPPSGNISVESPWFGYFPSAPSKSVSQAVDAWAKAFTSGSPDQLLLAVGDEDASHDYMPLVGVDSVTSSVVASAYVPPAGAANYQSGQKTDQMIAQVTLILTWADAPALENGQRNTTKVTYDILVKRADTASPQVVAWGDPGTAPTLKAYQNALLGNDIQNGLMFNGTKTPSTPKPTPTETPESEAVEPTGGTDNIPDVQVSETPEDGK